MFLAHAWADTDSQIHSCNHFFNKLATTHLLPCKMEQAAALPSACHKHGVFRRNVTLGVLLNDLRAWIPLMDVSGEMEWDSGDSKISGLSSKKISRFMLPPNASDFVPVFRLRVTYPNSISYSSTSTTLALPHGTFIHPLGFGIWTFRLENSRLAGLFFTLPLTPIINANKLENK